MSAWYIRDSASPAARTASTPPPIGAYSTPSVLGRLHNAGFGLAASPSQRQGYGSRSMAGYPWWTTRTAPAVRSADRSGSRRLPSAVLSGTGRPSHHVGSGVKRLLAVVMLLAAGACSAEHSGGRQCTPHANIHIAADGTVSLSR
jgi:hypothetical protein